ncbi:TraB/GumN family protein [Geomicrobium sp. JSM 1781026]|uniref:TraB/GumN family protein n=1 Tax=Geomicrobium sp. JSM 1781026 TaxID=3344580 RepID=UPI0035BEFC5B
MPNDHQRSAQGTGGFLWEVNNGGINMFLFGTIHLGTNDFYPLDPIVEEAFDNADIVMPEINVNEKSMDQETLMKLAMFKDGNTLDQVLSKRVYHELSVLLLKYDMDIKDFHMFQPWLMDLILVDLATKESNVDSEKSVDLYLLNRAEKLGKEIVPLESEGVQSEIFSSFTLETQIQALERTVRNFSNLPKETEQSAHNWLNRDIQSFKNTRIDFENDGINKEYFQGINDRRNLEMAEKIDQVLRSGLDKRYFLFVGCFHVILEPSLPTILDNKGYNVARIL